MVCYSYIHSYTMLYYLSYRCSVYGLAAVSYKSCSQCFHSQVGMKTKAFVSCRRRYSKSTMLFPTEVFKSCHSNQPFLHFFSEPKGQIHYHLESQVSHLGVKLTKQIGHVSCVVNSLLKRLDANLKFREGFRSASAITAAASAKAFV